MTYTPGTIYVALLTPDGRPESGEVLVIPRSSPITDPTDGRIALPGRAGPVRLVPTEIDELDEDGEPTGRKLHPGVASIDVPPTLGMDPDYVPYDVWVKLDRQKEKPLIVMGVEVPAGETVNLAQWTETTTAPGTPNVQRAAEAARDRAETAAGSAEESATSAGAAAGAAAGSADAAHDSELAAAQSATAAATASDEAVAARQGAESAQGAAATSEQAADGSAASASSSADAAAESATAAADDRARAETAAGAAETAQGQAESARDTAHTSELAAAAAQAAAEAAQEAALEQAGISTAGAAGSLASSVAAAASAQTATDKAAAIPSMPVLGVNLCGNPLGVGLFGFQPVSGTVIVADATVPILGAPSIKATSTIPNGGVYTTNSITRAAVTIGKTYTVSAYVIGEAGKFSRIETRELNAAAGLLRSVIGPNVAMTGDPSVPQRLTVTITPTEASTKLIDVVVRNWTTGGQVQWVSGWQIEEGSAATPFIVGSQPGQRFTGTPNASPSERLLPNVSDLTFYSQQAVRHYEGYSGFPEGVVTASPGATYTDLGGSNGAWGWRKRTGTGNAGWVCVEGDTGWRLVVNGTVANMPGLKVLLKREGSRVSVAVGESAPGTAAGLTTLYTLPAGFRSPSLGAGVGLSAAPVVSAASGAPVAGAALTVSRGIASSLVRLSAVSGQRHDGEISFDTTDPWPASLPGTAV